MLKSTYWESYYIGDPYLNPPESNSPVFVDINMPMKLTDLVPSLYGDHVIGEIFETGLLRYGNANPDSDDFDSLADYCFTDNGVEIRLPCSC